MDSSAFIGLILSAVLGGLIGIERELPRTWSIPHNPMSFWGIRTFASISIMWAIAVEMDIIFQTFYWTLFWALMSGFLIITSYVYSSFKQGRVGNTTEYAAFITYFIGVIAMHGNYIFAIILSILYLLILSTKDYLEALKERLSRRELWDSLKFAVVALVILPILPDNKYSLLDMINWFYHGGFSENHAIFITPFLNPYSIWFFVVILIVIEYIWYILSKVIGSKWGIIISGAIWGIISSTATTVAMTKKSAEHPENRISYAVATLLASCIMFIRVIIISAIIYPAIIQPIIIPASGMFIALSGITLYYFVESRKQKSIDTDNQNHTNEHESPFQLGSALKFAGLIILIKFISMAGIVYQSFIPAKVSNYTLGLISGLVDIDPLILTVAGEAKSGTLLGLIAATTILIAVMSNNVVKSSIAYRFGEKEYGKMVLRWFVISIFVGLIIIVGMNFS